MLLVKTRIDRSKSHGIGLFANQFIPKGTKTWKYNPKYDRSYTRKSIDSLSPDAKKRFLDYAYFDFKLKKFILCFDDQRFINHSNRPNIKSTPTTDVAIRDIKIGEELLCNYEDYEKGWFEVRGFKKDSFE